MTHREQLKIHHNSLIVTDSISRGRRCLMVMLKASLAVEERHTCNCWLFFDRRFCIGVDTTRRHETSLTVNALLVLSKRCNDLIHLANSTRGCWELPASETVRPESSHNVQVPCTGPYATW